MVNTGVVELDGSLRTAPIDANGLTRSHRRRRRPRRDRDRGCCRTRAPPTGRQPRPQAPEPDTSGVPPRHRPEPIARVPGLSPHRPPRSQPSQRIREQHGERGDQEADAVRRSRELVQDPVGEHHQREWRDERQQRTLRAESERVAREVPAQTAIAPANSNAGVAGAGDTYSRACAPIWVASWPNVCTVSSVGTPSHSVRDATIQPSATMRPIALRSVAISIPRRSLAQATAPDTSPTHSSR